MGRNTGEHAGLSPAAAERAGLCALMREVGESAPTLCAGWDAGDLAAHLVVRESRPDALFGLVLPPLRGYTAHVEKSTRGSVPFAQLVDKLERGPSLRTPLGLPVVKNRGNLHEYFIHHEDLRRAQPGWQSRVLPAQESSDLWDLVRLMAPMLVHGLKGARLTLQTPSGAERSLGRADSKHQVTVTGEPGELLLYLSGRRPVAEVRVTGPQAAQARLAAAPLGM